MAAQWLGNLRPSCASLPVRSCSQPTTVSRLSLCRPTHRQRLSFTRQLSGQPMAPANTPHISRPAPAVRPPVLAGYAGSARGQPVPMRGPGPAEFKKAPGVAEARRQMLESLPLESFKVVGVSFEGRQEVVSKLQTAQALMLVKEPHNEHDPNAVAVLTLAGAQLGYVPRELTQNFTQDVTFASVYSFGANELGLYGAQVAVRPTLPPLTLDALPASLAAAANLSQEVAKDEWDRLRRTTYRNANFRCEITGGAGPDHPVECHERWYLDDVTHTAKLMGLMALAPEVHLAKHADRQKDERRRQAAIWTLQEVNEWNVNEADTYLRYVAAKAAERSQHAWKFDLGWLEAQGCQIPARLQALCRASPAIATP